MYTSKLKLTLHWLLFTVGFYLFWALSYLVLAKFALSQFNRFSYAKESIWSQLTASDIFWFAMFAFGIAITIFVIRKFIQFAPNTKIAAIVYAILIIGSVVVLLDKLLETGTVFDILPHVIINIAFLIPIAMTFFRKEEVDQEENEEEGADPTI
jgi:FlaA1/EpsC-like NDP-sugar epimerase